MVAINILIINDNEPDRLLCENLLNTKLPNNKNEDIYTFIEAESKEDLDSIMKNGDVSKIDCVIIDYNLPDSDGLECIDFMKNSKKLCELPILMLTGDGNETIAVEAVRKGAINYLMKDNISTLYLQSNIRNAIEENNILKKSIEEGRKLKELALRDSLTEFDNRFSFENKLQECTKHAGDHDKNFALLFIDVDDFKDINDSLGHDVGDDFLIAISKRLKSCLRETDVIARIDGDEFAIIYDVRNVNTFNAVPDKIISSLSLPINIRGNIIKVSVSIGVAIYPKDGNTVTDLLKYADLAMYYSKSHGKSCWNAFDLELDEKFSYNLKIERGLQKAIHNDELRVEYQPVFLPDGKTISGFEELLRWTNNGLGVISPDIFIPLAEELGCINEIGYFVIDETMKQFSSWQKKYNMNKITMSINISPIQLKDEALVTYLNKSMSSNNINPKNIVVEITETSHIEEDEILGTLIALKELGIRIAIDDFGTGYSTLQNVHTLPIDILKIDKSFVSQIQEDNNSAKLVKSVFCISNHFDLTVVAEGVETKEQMKFLVDNNCDLFQGFLFHPSLPPKEVEVLLKKQCK
ncbi:MAG: EAL domain-containing protein [Francisellaceae bacterium]|nr:EAL domain-containing protein [Francisellaceae bacterium]